LTVWASFARFPDPDSFHRGYPVFYFYWTYRGGVGLVAVVWFLVLLGWIPD
jgi:hypothetical protein